MTHTQCSAATASDFEQVFRDACDEAGCEYDNEALLSSIANLTSYADMLWAWFTERRGAEDMRANATDGGLSAEDFRQMLNDHEANLLPDEPQTVPDSALAKCEECGIGPCESCMNSGYKHPDRAELALAADELAKLPDAVYWLLAKGRTRPDEPLWGIGITNHAGEAIAEAEGDHPADVVRAAASKISRSTS
jgi:hypothetical protein